MNIDNEKKNNNILEIAKSICKDLKLSIDDYEISILDEIDAGVMNPKEQAIGLRRYIIGENGSYLTCFSSEPLDFSIEMFKQGHRDSIFKNKEIVDSIVNKIKEMPSNTKTTIAELIGYNPEENYVSPLTQGEVSSAVIKVCKNNGIDIEEIENGFGGLAYYYPFKKVDNDKVKAYMEDFINKPVAELSDKEKEFENFCKLYEERFGKRAYIAEPSGTREQTINAIKICLDKNEDLLDKLLYPNFEDDVNNGVLYSEHNISDTNETSKLISYEEYKHMFEKDSNGCYLRLVIPQEDNLPELNLVGKMPNDFTTEEIIRMKKYANKMFNMVDKKNCD